MRELRETPTKKNQKFVEFFDVRDASKALTAMNGKELNGKAIVIEFSRPGGHCRKFFQNALSFNSQQPPPPPPPPSSPPIYNKNARRFTHLAQPQLASRKPAGNKGNNDDNNNNKVEDAVSLETTTRGLSNMSVVVEQEEKKCEGVVNIVAPRQQQGRCRNWKGKSHHHQGKKQETRFLIKEDAIVESSCKDSRTTVMIKNIPNKYRSVSCFHHFLIVPTIFSLFYAIKKLIINRKKLCLTFVCVCFFFPQSKATIEHAGQSLHSL